MPPRLTCEGSPTNQQARPSPVDKVEAPGGEAPRSSGAAAAHVCADGRPADSPPERRRLEIVRLQALAGGRSGPSAHFRAAGSCSGSSQSGQT